jgi:hypothetical protein
MQARKPNTSVILLYTVECYYSIENTEFLSDWCLRVFLAFYWRQHSSYPVLDYFSISIHYFFPFHWWQCHFTVTLVKRTYLPIFVKLLYNSWFHFYIRDLCLDTLTQALLQRQLKLWYLLIPSHTVHRWTFEDLKDYWHVYMFGLIVFNAGLAMYSFCEFASIPMLSN